MVKCEILPFFILSRQNLDLLFSGNHPISSFQSSVKETIFYTIFSCLMVMNCFCGMVDRPKVLRLISSRDHCQIFSWSQISYTPGVGFEPARSLISRFVE